MAEPPSRWYFRFMDYAGLGLVLAPPAVLFTDLFLTRQMTVLEIFWLWIGCWLGGGALLALEEFIREGKIRVAGFIATWKRIETIRRISIIGVVFILAFMELQIHSAQSDLENYVLPRTITKDQ